MVFKRKVIKQTQFESCIFETFNDAHKQSGVSRSTLRGWLLRPCSRNGVVYLYEDQTEAEEEWKFHPILNIRVSNFGNIETQRGKRKGSKTYQGYYKIKVFGKYYMTHRLVAESWLNKETLDQIQVNHIDHNKSNNHVSNLEWVTPSQNMKKWHLHSSFSQTF